MRFAFGDNWKRFLADVDDRRIAEAEQSLTSMLRVDSLSGMSFLDAGSGSGLFSLAARRLGARVHSFDSDPASVWCTQELRRRRWPGGSGWTVDHASVLDATYLERIGRFDIVYCWGVLHHSGDLWKGLTLVSDRVRTGGKLFIAVYNDGGWASRWWRVIKRVYCRLPHGLKPLLLYPAAVRLWGPRMLWDLLHLRPLATWRQYVANRGMSPWRDVVDWVGGYPYEVATPAEIFEHLSTRGFVLTALKTTNRLGNNQFVFRNGA